MSLTFMLMMSLKLRNCSPEEGGYRAGGGGAGAGGQPGVPITLCTSSALHGAQWT